MRRARPLPALLLAAAAVLTGCGTDAETAAPVPTVSATTTPPGKTVETTRPEPEISPDDAQLITINVAGGEVSGVEPRTAVPLGTRVRLTITSDEPDEVHVHGFDLTEPVPAGQALTLEFVADQPGIFEVELHDSRNVLTRLQVQ